MFCANFKTAKNATKTVSHPLFWRKLPLVQSVAKVRLRFTGQSGVSWENYSQYSGFTFWVINDVPREKPKIFSLELAVRIAKSG
jgi:hypothetical protein